MAKKTVCDVCEKVIKDGANVGLRRPVFTHEQGAITVEVTTTARVNGNSEADLCVACLKRAVALA